MPKTDVELGHDVEAELRWESRIDAGHIGVTVSEGVVSLFGLVDTYAEKWEAADTVKRVVGVRSVADYLTVTVLGPHKRTDAEIETAAFLALQHESRVPASVIAIVRDACITLSGDVDWESQRQAAMRAVRFIVGTERVIDNIKVTRPRP